MIRRKAGCIHPPRRKKQGLKRRIRTSWVKSRILRRDDERSYGNLVQELGQEDLNPRRHKVKKVTRRHKGEGGGGQSDPSPLLLTPFIRLTRYLTHIMSVLCTFS